MSSSTNSSTSRPIIFKHEGIKYTLSPLRTISYEGKEYTFNSFDNGQLNCTDLESDIVVNIPIERVDFYESEKDEIIPYYYYNGAKIKLDRRNQTLIKNGESVTIMYFDNQSKKLLCKLENGDKDYFDPIDDFVGFRNLADSIVRKNNMAKINFEHEGNSYRAYIQYGFTEVMVDGKLKKGKIFGNNNDFSRLFFEYENGIVAVTLEDLANCNEIKNKTILNQNKSTRTSNTINFECHTTRKNRPTNNSRYSTNYNKDFPCDTYSLHRNLKNMSMNGNNNRMPLDFQCDAHSLHRNSEGMSINDNINHMPLNFPMNQNMPHNELYQSNGFHTGPYYDATISEINAKIFHKIHLIGDLCNSVINIDDLTILNFNEKQFKLMHDINTLVFERKKRKQYLNRNN